MAEDDTDTLIAMLSSLLDPPIPDQSVLLEALVDCNGDIRNAARAIQLMQQQKHQGDRWTKKRKHTDLDLQDWLIPLKRNTSNATKTLSDFPQVVEAYRPGDSSASVKIQSLSSPQSHTASSSNQTIDLMGTLRPPPSTPPAILPRLPPLTLSTPALVARHTPCTLHASILPQELACQLFHTMIDESRSWSRNKWWLFDKVVESPHLTSFYVRRQDGVDGDGSWQEAAQLWYNGRKTEPPAVFPKHMEEACRYIEKVVNDEFQKRKRFSLEWGGVDGEGQTWKANVAAANCYEGTKEGVGYHSDQLTYLGPYPTIASLSLGTTRVFRLREVVPRTEADKRHARTYNIPLPHNSLVIMHASTQERFKHSIPPQSVIDTFRPAYPRTPGEPIESSNCRINITFRFFRPDFCQERTPRCKCNIPMILRPDMKNRHDGKEDKYWWTCYAGAQNDGKGCATWKVMDVKAEGRGPFVKDVQKETVDSAQRA